MKRKKNKKIGSCAENSNSSDTLDSRLSRKQEKARARDAMDSGVSLETKAEMSRTQKINDLWKTATMLLAGVLVGLELELALESKLEEGRH